MNVFSNDSALRPYALASVGLAALLVVIVVFGFRQQTGTNTNTANTNTSAGTSVRIVETSAGFALPAEAEVVTSRIGVITRIADTGILFRSRVFDAKNGAYTLAELDAITGASTVYSLEDDRKPLTPPAPGAPAPTRVTTTISRTELAVGDSIQVFSADNLVGKTTFGVTEVRKLLTQ